MIKNNDFCEYWLKINCLITINYKLTWLIGRKLSESWISECGELVLKSESKEQVDDKEWERFVSIGRIRREWGLLINLLRDKFFSVDNSALYSTSWLITMHNGWWYYLKNKDYHNLDIKYILCIYHNFDFFFFCIFIWLFSNILNTFGTCWWSINQYIRNFIVYVLHVFHC